MKLTRWRNTSAKTNDSVDQTSELDEQPTRVTHQNRETVEQYELVPAIKSAPPVLRQHSSQTELLLAAVIAELSVEYRLPLKARALRHTNSWELLVQFLIDDLPQRFIDAASKELEHAAAHGDEVISVLDDEYPIDLSVIDHPPPVLYIRGALPPDGIHLRHSVGIVGARACSSVGEDLAERFAADVTTSGAVVISGLARGIDGAAHRGALKGARRWNAGNVPLLPGVAIMASGLSEVYPPEHRPLAEALVSEGGALISEFPYSMPPKPTNFLRRNRIISALSDVVLVVEAARRSGSLATARYATEQGKDVGAIPGMITRKEHGGSNDLLRQGAHVILEPRDLLLLASPSKRDSIIIPDLEEAKAEKPTKKMHPLFQASTELSAMIPPELTGVYAILASPDGTLFDTLVISSGIPSSQVASQLLDLELLGVIQQLPGGRYVRKELVDTL